LKRQWCLPPGKPDAEFVCQMEDVLDIYERPANPDEPLVCMDEMPKQLIGEKRMPLPSSPGQPQLVDYEYKRNGVANIFMAVEPLTGRTVTEVTRRRTKVDWAHFMKKLVDQVYATAKKIILVMDNLNIHAKASLYEAFEPGEAKRIADKLEIHYTPKHASWLNMAEIELSILFGQCLDRRIPAIQLLEKEVCAWEYNRNHKLTPIKWQFTTQNARIKLRRLYPKFQT